MDIVAALHWLRENLHAFGGDPDRITLMGHGTGASLANILAVSPVAKGKNRLAIGERDKKFFFFNEFLIVLSIIAWVRDRVD